MMKLCISTGRELRHAVVLAGLCLCLAPHTATAQTEAIDTHIHQLDAQIAQAAAAQDYEAAAALQKDRQTWLELKQAVEAQDSGRIMALTEALQHPYVYQAKGSAPAPTASAPADNGPEFINQVYLMTAGGEYRQLEKQEGHNSSSHGGYGGFGGGSSSYKIAGAASNVRLAPGQYRFVIKTYPGQDPSDLIELVKFDPDKGHNQRGIQLSKSSHYGWGSSREEVTDNRLRLSFKNIGPQLYEITIEDPIGDGEYGFMNGDKVYAFGIDK
ncbi:MAG: hypothetical protein H6597_06825 [Flavobacteriales bacterium]|nr:hypothetical protein [Flavobacteriales bacterium]